MSTEARVSHCKVWPPGQETKPRQVLIVCWATGGDPAANRPTLSQPCHPPRCGQGYCVVPPPCSLETLTGWDSQLLVLQLTILETCPSHPLWEPHFLLPQSLVPSSLLLHLQSGGIFADSTEASGSWSIPYTRPACQHSPPRSHMTLQVSPTAVIAMLEGNSMRLCARAWQCHRRPWSKVQELFRDYVQAGL